MTGVEAVLAAEILFRARCGHWSDRTDGAQDVGARVGPWHVIAPGVVVCDEADDCAALDRLRADFARHSALSTREWPLRHR